MRRATKRRSSVRRDDAAIAKFYDNQDDPKVVAEIEAVFDDRQTVMVPVPRSMLADVLKLIDKKKSA